MMLCTALAGCTADPGTPPAPSPAPTPASPTEPAAATIPPTAPASLPSAAGGTQPGSPPTGAPVVLLDAGHNGGNATHPSAVHRPVPDGRGGTKPCNTTGTATDAGYPEHAFTFDVTRRVTARLVAAGVRVVSTRPDDGGVGPCVDERGRAGGVADADAVVSIHADGSAASHQGYHVALSAPPLNPAQSGPARELARDLRDAMRAAGFPDSDYAGRDGLAPRSDLAGLNLSSRPAVLVECANMRNPREAVMVSSAAGRERYAAAISAGILAFLSR
ncbi:MAG TPA: N-acetylmuramoyl-L-alanine amidase [Pseudonocardia sp.]|nr:N-acetylmuramoyl-L-alanine amidase [Pseudonocardia sp.]